MKKSHLHYIIVNAVSEFRIEYASSVFSLLWIILQPLFLITIYAFVFSTIMNAKIKGISGDYSYALFLCSGILPWTIFTNSLISGTSSITENATYIKKLSIPLPVFVIKSVLRVSINMFFYFFLLIIFAVFVADYEVSWHWLLIPMPLILLQFFVLGISLILAGLNVFFRDISHFIPLILQFSMWTVPIVYPLNIIPDKFQPLVKMNPLYVFFHSIRQVFLHNSVFSFRDLSLMISFSTIAIVCGYTILQKLRVEIRDSV